MRASRLVELLLLLQLRGGASASELAAELEVSTRTVYRDVEALAAAGVPVYTETGRNGGVRLLEGYRVAGLPALADDEARGAVLAAVPSVAKDLGVDPAAGVAKVLASMDHEAAAAAGSVRDRLLIEPEEWFTARDETPHLLDLARGVWECHEVRIGYRRRDRTTSSVIRPLGLVLKGGTWYALAADRRGGTRVYRVGRIVEAAVLGHRFERPDGFDLATEWAARQEAFAASLPTYHADVRVAPAGERYLALLQEGTPPLPLPPDVERDEAGWARLRLRFERPASAARLLLQLGPDVEVLAPQELRDLMAEAAGGLHELYRGGGGPRS